MPVDGPDHKLQQQGDDECPRNELRRAGGIDDPRREIAPPGPARDRRRQHDAGQHDLSEHAGGRLTVISENALATNLAEITPPPRRVIANLPYNIGTQLLINWLEVSEAFLGFTLMFQKEVAERIVSSPGNKSYGRLSVLARWLTKPRAMFDIPATAFVPPPNVTSSVINLEVRPEPLAPARREDLELVTRAAFGQRRKMLRRALSSIGGAEMLANANVPEDARAEDLSVEQFCAIARVLGDRELAR